MTSDDREEIVRSLYRVRSLFVCSQDEYRAITWAIETGENMMAGAPERRMSSTMVAVHMAVIGERQRCACILRRHVEFWHDHALDIPSAAELAAECENILTEITGKQEKP